MMGDGWRGRLEVLSSAAMFVAAASILYSFLGGPVPRGGSPATVTRAQTLPTAPLSLEGAPIMGAPSARIVMIVYSDFECPFCADFALTIVPMLKAQYVDKGLLRIAFRHYPLDRIHPNALPAATASACANLQGRFWQVHDKLFALRKISGSAAIRNIVADTGVDLARYDACSRSEGPAQVKADIAGASVAGVRGTPAIFIGVTTDNASVTIQHRVSGSRSVAEFQQIIDGMSAGLK